MTDEKLEKANLLKGKISDLDNIIKQLNSNEYDHFNIHGVCDDGVSDYIDLIPTEGLKVIKQWYASR